MTEKDTVRITLHFANKKEALAGLLFKVKMRKSQYRMVPEILITLFSKSAGRKLLSLL
jgi:hypothetical protein